MIFIYFFHSLWNVTNCTLMTNLPYDVCRNKLVALETLTLIPFNVLLGASRHGLVDRMVESKPSKTSARNTVADPGTLIPFRRHTIWHHFPCTPNTVWDPNCCANDAQIRLVFGIQVDHCHDCTTGQLFRLPHQNLVLRKRTKSMRWTATRLKMGNIQAR